MGKPGTPKHVCLDIKTGTRWEKHEEGPVIFVSGRWVAFGCNRCGVVYWECPGPSQPTYDDRCHGTTTVGNRCKLTTVLGDYCMLHQDQKPPDST